MFDLSGKHALVTGASGGIGGAIARALHGQGAAVALSGTRRPALEALAEALGGPGERVHIRPATWATPRPRRPCPARPRRPWAGSISWSTTPA